MTGFAVSGRGYAASADTLSLRKMREGMTMKRMGKVGSLHVSRISETPEWKRVGRIVDATFNANWAEESEEHTSELQSRENLVCRLLLEKKTEDDADRKLG